ncbi:uncharacterized protein [Diabrotica undecimpunctata]|uniref:uncharacterized protein n=1 Tax=Diabrotica undecimpunctata TaxID=50387 RepID=UPI003B63EE86
MGKDVEKNKVTIIQCNLQHKKVATATLCRRLDVTEDAIALIQEPWINKTKITGLSSLKGQIFSLPSNQQPRTAINVPRKIKASPMAQFCTLDVTAVEVRCPWGKGKNRELILASVYLPSDAATLPPTREMEDLVDHCLSQKVELIIGCDSNYHHLGWGSRDNNARAEISNKIQNWQVSEDISMSDHRWLTYNISLEKSLIKSRDPRRTDVELYNRLLEDALRNEKASTPGVGTPGTNTELESYGLNPNSDLISFYFHGEIIF